MVLCKPLKKRKDKKYKVLGFDIETHTDKNTFILGVFVSDNFKLICKTPKEVQDFLNSQEAKKYIMATTNVGFDFLGTFKDLPDQQYKVNERNGTIYSCCFYQHNNRFKKIMFYDTIRFFPQSVAGLGKICKIPKTPHPSFFPNKPKNDQEWTELIDYCENDAYISYKFMQDFVLKYLNDNDLSLRSTIGSISMADFKTNYLKETIEIEDFRKHKICFKGYYGGRTEVFRRGKFTKVNCFDFNSLYPSCMVGEFPDPKHGYFQKKSCIYDIMNKEGIGYVEGYQDKCFIPLLPVRKEGKLLFPTGEIKGYYTFIELREALKNGFTIKKIGEAVTYTQTQKYFKDFVEDKYKIRLEQKSRGDPLQLMTKLILNNLYGKFCFNFMEKSQIIQEADLKGENVSGATSIVELGGGYFAVNTASEKPTSYSFPIWGAYITAKARLKLYKALKENKDNLLYCDTDSLFLDQNKILPSSNKLGDLDHEYSVDVAYFVRPKFYFSHKAVIKGVRFVKDLKHFFEIVGGATIHDNRFIKFRTALRSKDNHKFGKLEINQVIPITKKLNVEDQKREWPKEFNVHESQTSKPLHL